MSEPGRSFCDGIRRGLFCFAYFACWMAWFAILRAAFVCYHFREASRAGIGTMARAFVHGAQMDVAATSYPAAVAFVLVAISGFFPVVARWCIAVFTVGMLLLFALFSTIDMELFRAWGFHLDGAVLRYVNTPREMLASAGAAPMALLVMVLLVLSAIGVAAFIRLLWPAMRRWQPLPVNWSLLTVLIGGGLTWGLYYPSRGGIQKMPMTQSTVYFSRNAFANQAAINVAWNYFDSIWWRSYRTDNPYVAFTAVDATRIADSLRSSGAAPVRRLLRFPRPNVIIVLWESLTSKIVERLGGVRGVTTNLDSLMHDGILFDHFYATGDRSPEGLTGVISGYPAQPTTEIIQHPHKSASLPALPHDLARAGYHSTFYYGGDPEFTNFKSYLMQAGFGTLVTKNDFDPRDRLSDWGADDSVVLHRLLTDVAAMRRPFFATLFTLSSHDPFVVPMRTVIAGHDQQSLFLNSHVYTDRSIGEFIREARARPWWDSTVVIILGDHGHRLPVLDSLQSARKWELYTIPMLWLGGALAVRDTVITRLGVQTDLPRTLLAQLGLDQSAYPWSRNLLASDVRRWAWFTFTDGFGWVNQAGGAMAWDNIGKRMIAQQGPIGGGDLRAGQALLQGLVDDYIKR